MPGNHEVFGREHELSALRRMVEDVAAGGGGVAMVQGPAGIGKSSLLLLAEEHADRIGLGTVHVRCALLEGYHPFGVTRQVTASLLGTAAPGPDPTRTRSRDAGVVVTPTGNIPDVGIVSERAGRITDAVQHHPTLLIVDDLQWCDVASLHVLGFLARRVLNSGLGMVLARRDVGGDLVDRLLDVEPGVSVPGRTFDLGPLGRDAVEQILTSEFQQPADPEFVSALMNATGGSPVLVHQVVAACHRAGMRPEEAAIGAIVGQGRLTVAKLVAARLAGATAATRRVTLATAVLGPNATVEAVARTSGESVQDVEAALTELHERALLGRLGTIGFAHDLVREAVLVAVEPHELSAMHRRAADALADLNHPIEVWASHLLEVMPAGDESVVVRLERAAEAALDRFDGDAAAAYLRRALEEPASASRRLDLLIAAADAEARTDHPAAVAHLRQAGREATDRARRGDIHAALAGLLVSSRPAEAAEEAKAALAQMDPRDSERRDIVIADMALARLLSEPRVELPAELRDRILRTADGTTLGAAMTAAVLGFESVLANRPRDRAIDQVVDATTRAGFDSVHRTGPAFAIGLIALSAIDAPEYRDLAASFVRAVDGTGSSTAAVSASLHVAEQLWADGDLPEAVDVARQGLRQAARYGIKGAGVSYLHAIVGHCERDRGNFEEASRVLDAAAETAGEAGGVVYLAGVDGAKAALLEIAEPERALGAWQEIGRRYRLVGGVSPVFVPWRSRAAGLLAAIGDSGGGSTLAEEEVALARTCGAPRTLARSLRSAGALAPGATGVAMLEESLGLVRPSPFRLDWARSALVLGQRLAELGRLDEARSLLDEAQRLATGCGAAVVNYQVNVVLETIGSGDGAPDLTRRQRQVSLLAAQGLSNREIADRLFLGVRTIESHLAAAFKVLGINERRQLRRALGLPDSQG